MFTRIAKAAARNLATKTGRISPETTALYLCDMQEVFRPGIHKFPEIVESSRRLFEVAKILDMPIIVTEHYTKAFGHTVKDLGDVSPYLVDEKTCFTMLTPKVQQKLKEKHPQVESAIITGIEAHACVMATTFDLLEQGIDVHLPVNAISSRTKTDRLGGLSRCRQSGAYLTTAESLLFQLLGDAKHPKFKAASKFIREPMPETDIDEIF